MGEERLSWFTPDWELKSYISVPDNLPEGKEENRVLPWVFHESSESRLMDIKCIMRGYNVSNNPADYKNARWSHPGFTASQVDTSAHAVKGEEDGVPYAIWTIKINTSDRDAGKKWVTCEFQQGDSPLSTDFKFLFFKRLPVSLSGAGATVNLTYGLGLDVGDVRDIHQQIEDDIKKQVSKYYGMTEGSVTRAPGGLRFNITVAKEKVPDDDETNEGTAQYGEDCVSTDVCSEAGAEVCSVIDMPSFQWLKATIND